MRRRRGHIWVGLAALVCVGAAHGQVAVRVVVLSHRVTNVGQVAAESVTARCVLPASNGYQEVLDLKVSPGPASEETDAEGQRMVTVELGPLAPGQTRAVMALAYVRLKKAWVPLGRVQRQGQALTEQRKAAYLRDGPRLQLAQVRPIAEQAAAGQTEVVDQARALFDYMAEHCRYNIDFSEDASLPVLQGKRASCSELANAYVAMCRSLGIPARQVLAFVNRDEELPCVDWQSHRWTEFHAEGIGWVPVDPTNRLNDPKGRYFGQQSPKYLTVVDNGQVSMEGQDPGWHNFLVRTEPAEVALEFRRSAAFRQSESRRQEEAFFEEASALLREAEAGKRLAAVRQWGQEYHPLRFAFLVEALFDVDASVRAAAAVGLGRTRYVTVIQPLLDRAEGERDFNALKAMTDTVRTFLNTDDEQRKADAVGELIKSRSNKGLEILGDIWKDPSRQVRKQVALMMHKLGDLPKVHEAYAWLVDDEDDYIRVAAALRWARLGSHVALEYLVKHLESDNAWDREQALAELKKRTGGDFGFNPKLGKTSRENTAAVEKFREWLEAHPEAK